MDIKVTDTNARLIQWVKLNGVQLKGCTAFNSEEGWVDSYTNEQGKVCGVDDKLASLGGVPMNLRFHGKVTYKMLAELQVYHDIHGDGGVPINMWYLEMGDGVDYGVRFFGQEKPGFKVVSNELLISHGTLKHLTRTDDGGNAYTWMGDLGAVLEGSECGTSDARSPA